MIRECGATGSVFIRLCAACNRLRERRRCRVSTTVERVGEQHVDTGRVVPPRDYAASARFRRSQITRFFLAGFFALTVIYFAAQVLAAWLRGSFGGLR